MPPVLLVSYTLFSLFLFYQQLHLKTFRGGSQVFHFLLAAFALVAMLGGFGFLLYYGYEVSWLGALMLFGIALAVKVVWFGIEAKLGLRGLVPYISLAGFIAIPVCSYFMWWGFPG